MPASPAWWTQSLCRSMIQCLALMWAWNRSPSPVMGKSRDNPRCYRRAQRELRRKQSHGSRLSKVLRAGARPVGSPPSCTAMCSHQRNDFQHKLSRELVNHYGRIAVEVLAKLLDQAESADRVLVKVERNLATMPWWKACSEETLESAPSVFMWSKHNPRPRLGIGNSTARTAPKNRNACHSGGGS